MTLTYWDYLKLDTLLNLQEAKSNPPEHDELLFIIIHQTYELWFKLLIHELDQVKRDFAVGELYGPIATFKRCRTVMKTLVEQVDILETMTPLSFSSFRDRLDTASGFQSAQFRELEFLLGYKRPDMLKHQPEPSPHRAVLERRLNEPSVVDAFYLFLTHHGVILSAAIRNQNLREPATGNAEIQEALFHLYKNEPILRILFELMTDFDEGLQEWRYRHVKLVERTIGQKHGTGGSLGVEFLKQSLFRPVFFDLWAIRHRL